ncbi:MAG: UDP-N-acetylmuramoyl-L-alanine--D-glutamate ligase [bacterium]|nr:UDP-N-acetylmuramoyl-L-alanine--D-glutamate ligase [bacterium]
MNFQNTRIAVLGLGKSGVALAKQLSARGAAVLLSDSNTPAKIAEIRSELEPLGVEIEVGGHSPRVLNSDLIVVSPGVSVFNPLLQEALHRGVKVMGEVEIAWRISPAPFVAVTGTNGKSTTVTLIDRMLGERSILAGNIGNPLVAEVGGAPKDGYVVAEISSFQLETVYDFAPHVAVLTNFTTDHLDRHKDMQEYFAAKARLFAHMGPKDLAVFSADDPGAVRMFEELCAGQLPAWIPEYPAPACPPCPRLMTFSVRGEVENGAWFQDGWLYYRNGGLAERLFRWDFPGLPGPHNLANALAAVAVARSLGVSALECEAALREHQPLHHRLQLVREREGVVYIDDSKGTNPDAVIAALRSYERPIVLIAGGKDKGVDVSEMMRVIAERVKYLILIGEASERFAAEAQKAGVVSVGRSADLQAAVREAARLAKPGDAVILSPACSSFDMFKNAEERGDLFVKYVQEL